MLLLTVLVGMAGVIERVVETSRVPCVDARPNGESLRSLGHTPAQRSVRTYAEKISPTRICFLSGCPIYPWVQGRTDELQTVLRRLPSSYAHR